MSWASIPGKYASWIYLLPANGKLEESLALIPQMARLLVLRSTAEGRATQHTSALTWLLWNFVFM